MVRRLIEAAKPRPSRSLARHANDIRRLAREFGISDVRAFGSAARGDDRPGSDLDLLVRVPAGTGLFTLLEFAHAVEDFLGVPIDVISEGGLDHSHADIHREAVTI